MADLLLELFSEEIPARMQQNAGLALFTLLEKALKEAGVAFKASGPGFSTPRRLALILTGLPTAQPDVNTELKGPKIDAPEAALQGFLKKSGLKQDQLEKRDGVYFAQIHQKGRATAEVLKEIIEKILAEFPWPKSMRWGSRDITWVRPLHSILCLFDGKVIPVQFGTVTAGNVTYGHRFLSPGAITVTNPADYEAQLEKAHVIADREKRKAKILQLAQAAASAKNIAMKDDAGLLDEVTGLVEWPVVLTGSIDAKFMDLPPEVLTTVMRSHQKYFSLLLPSPAGRGEGEGALAPYFLITSNMETKDGGKAITAGNERVLRARFSDARFFWDQDRKKPLSEWAGGLKDVTFHAKLGSVADKVERIKALALQLAPYIPSPIRGEAGRGANLAQPGKTGPHPNPPPIGEGIVPQVERAAALCKADLVTGMVGEFAELQGIMGRYYALQQKEDAAVADAIRDHYKPQGPNDSVPVNPVSVCIALADKLDTLVSMFAIGEKPTGSKDPFALRRAALGVIRNLRENVIRCDLVKLLPVHLETARQSLIKNSQMMKPSPVIGMSDAEYITTEILGFLAERLIVQLKDEGIRHDVIRAVFAHGEGDLVRVVARAKAVQGFLATDDGKNLLIAYKRAANILKIEEKNDNTTYHASIDRIAVIGEKGEIDLIHALEERDSTIPLLLKDEAFEDIMVFLAGLRYEVDKFFDTVLINCEDKELRVNRLRLLSCIRDIMNNVANFALIEG